MNFLGWKAQAGLYFTRIFIIRENIHATRVVTSAGELGTISKNNLRGLNLGIRPTLSLYYIDLLHQIGPGNFQDFIVYRGK